MFTDAPLAHIGLSEGEAERRSCAVSASKVFCRIWPGSVLVIDPKGTYAAVTAARRGKGGGRVTASLGKMFTSLILFRLCRMFQSPRC
jgi:hypothetical protein